MVKKAIKTLLIVAGLLTTLVACNRTPTRFGEDDIPHGGKLNVVATTTIVGDVVRHVGGDIIDLQVLVPAGVDPHSFQPTPQDVAKLVEADVIFMNGAGLEGFMDSLLQNVGGSAKLVRLSDSLELLSPPSEAKQDGTEHDGVDPHVWMDPNNVVVWVESIQRKLSELDPENSTIYQANAEEYRISLVELDQWVSEQVAQIPVTDRELVTDHQVFGYFADRYGFEQIGAIIPSYSTMAEPSAQELAVLEDSIRDQSVKAIFVGETVNPSLAERVADDTNTQLVFLYTGSLTKYGGPVDNYLDFIRYNVTAIVSALK